MSDLAESPGTSPKMFVFVLMPFNKDFEDIYSLGIKAACEDAPAYCERVDEQVYEGTVLQRVYNQIAKADIIVADMTGRNPNVFYEVGYAHALNKRVVLLAQNADEIPFDLKSYPHIVYGEAGGKIAALKTELTRRLQWFVSNPERHSVKAADGLDLYLNSQMVAEGTTIAIRDARLVLRFAIYNRSAVTFQPDNLQIFVETPEGLIEAPGRSPAYRARRVEIPEKRRLFILDVEAPLFPQAWGQVYLHLHSTAPELSSAPIPLAIGLSTELGTRRANVLLVCEIPSWHSEPKT